MNDNLFNILDQSEHITDWELTKKLTKKPDTEYLNVKRDLSEMVAQGKATVIGKKFIDQHGKLFDVYTSRQDKLTERASSLSMKQKNSQMLSLANSLYDEFKDHLNTQALEYAAELIKKGDRKVSLQYHALEREDILKVYKKVIKNAPAWFVEDVEYNKDPEYTDKGTKKKYKIPY